MKKVEVPLENQLAMGSVAQLFISPCYISQLSNMIFPWMFDEIHALRKFKGAAHILAEKKDWPPLYDITALNNNKVPVVAAVYYEDMLVNFKLVMNNILDSRDSVVDN
ncbi:unnamed protein product [Prunus armeniaca]